MTNGELYSPFDRELILLRWRAQRLCRKLNFFSTVIWNPYRIHLIKRLFGKCGKKIYIESPFHCDYGFNISVGDSFYANSGCVFLDVTPISIGDHVLIGPNVQIYTATHPILSEDRSTGKEYGIPVSIGNNVWIGGHTVILPGVSIGDNSVIGAGSVVTKNIPSNVLAYGNPCRIRKELKPDS